jgi:hypothetical protein
MSVVVVLEAPVFDEDFGFEERVEGFQLEVPAPEVSVEGLDVEIRPGSAGFDIGRGDAGEAAPVLESFGDEFGAPLSQRTTRGVARHSRRSSRTDTTRSALIAPAGTDATHSRVIVGDVEDLDRSAFSGLVELEVHGPNVI